MKANELIAKLQNVGIRYIKPQDKFVIYPEDKPDSMSWPMFQFRLKEVARFNQNGRCICKIELGRNSELHHALITRKNVQGSKECKNLIHCSLNVIELCKDCHIHIKRKESGMFLANMFGNQYIIDWYNSVDDKMVSNLSRIEYYLPNWCATCGGLCDDKFCSDECSEYEDLE